MTDEKTNQTLELSADDFNIVKEKWIGKVIINHGSGGDENMSYDDANALKVRIMTALTIMKKLDHRIKFIRDFLDASTTENPETHKILEELECMRGLKA